MNIGKYAITRAELLLYSMICAVAFFLLWCWLGFWASYQSSTSEIVRLQPVMARLAGAEASAVTLQASNAELKQQLKLLVLPDEGDANAAAASLQQKVRSAMSEQGMSIVGSQILAPVEGEGFQELSLSMNLTGPIASVEASLEVLALMEPKVIVTSTQLSPARSRPGEQNINLRLNLVALRWKL